MRRTSFHRLGCKLILFRLLPKRWFYIALITIAVFAAQDLLLMEPRSYIDSPALRSGTTAVSSPTIRLHWLGETLKIPRYAKNQATSNIVQRDHWSAMSLKEFATVCVAPSTYASLILQENLQKSARYC